MPLGLVGWEPFGSACGLVGCNIEAGVNAGARGWMEVLLRCHNSPKRTEVTGASDVTHRKRAEVCVRIWREKESGTRRQTRRIERAPYRGRSSWGPNELDSIENCVSPPYVETFNSKLIKRFRSWTRSLYVFSNSEIPMFFIDSIVMNIICPFLTYR